MEPFEIETKINRFDGGITNDPRDSRRNVARVISNFDILSTPNKMTPYRSSEDADENASSRRKRNFCIARRTTDTYSLYALGRQAAADRALIEYKDITTGAANDLDDNNWAVPSNNQSSAGTTIYNLFVYYQRRNLIYGARNTDRIWAFSPSGSAWDDDVITTDGGTPFSFTRITQGVIHSKDDVLYIGYYNEPSSPSVSAIAKNNNATWSNTALSLPSWLMPTSLAEYGNYLAIGTAQASGIGNSRVFLWDRNTSLANVDESIDWGPGSLMLLEEIDGELIGISQEGGANAGEFNGVPSGTTSTRDRIVFRKLVGSRAVKIYELQANHASSSNSAKLNIQKYKKDGRLFFQMLIELNGAVRDGIWSFGRSAPDQPFTLVHERTSNNNTALTTSDALRGFTFVGDYLFQSYTSGGTHATNKTNDRSDSGAYSHYSVYESKKFDGRDSNAPYVDATHYKDLTEVGVMHEFLPASASVEMSYRTDENTSWTVIFTNSTDNSMSHVANNIESSGAALPKDYREIQFRIRVTGGDNSGEALGAEITGFWFKEDVKGRKYIAD